MEPGKGQQEDWKLSRQYSASTTTVMVWDLQETLTGHVPLGLSFLIQNYTGMVFLVSPEEDNNPDVQAHWVKISQTEGDCK